MTFIQLEETMKIKQLLLGGLLLTLGLAACASPTPAPDGAAAAPTARSIAVAPAATAAPAQPTGAAQPTAGADISAIALEPPGRMIIKDAVLEILVHDTDLAIAQLTQMAADNGGYILDEQTSIKDGYKYATLRLGIPSSAFEKTLNYVRQLGVQVLQETTSGQDVSAQYTDLQSKLTNLEATAARVREFLKNAQTVEESLKINGQLSDLEGQIEQVKGQMNYYQGRAAYSTVTLSLQPQLPTLPPAAPTPTPTPTPGWNPGRTLGQASGVLVTATQGTVDVVIWLVVVLGPLALFCALVIGGAVRLRRFFKH
jgi:hypothetical protein